MASRYYAVGMRGNYAGGRRTDRSIADRILDRTKVRAALKGKPDGFDTMAQAEAFHASLPADVQPLTEAYEFIYL